MNAIPQRIRLVQAQALHFVRAELPAGVLAALVALPQAVAIGMVAGITPDHALLALTLPALAYGVFGTSPVISVGPVYALALAVAEIAGARTEPGSVAYAEAVGILAIECGLWSALIVALRVGDAIHIVGRPVVLGVLNGTALIVIVRELPVLLGQPNPLPATTLLGIGEQLASGRVNLDVVLFSLGALIVLLVASTPRGRGPRRPRNAIAQLAPLAVVAAALLAGVGVAPGTGAHAAPLVPELPAARSPLWISLLPGSLLIAAIAYFQTRVLSARLPGNELRRQETRREVAALGVANLLSGLFGSLPVAGGPSRTMALHALGARTIGGVAVLAALAALAAGIGGDTLARVPSVAWSVIAVWFAISLFDFADLPSLWRFNRRDVFTCVAATVSVALFGIVTGSVLGFVVSVAVYLFRAGRTVLTELGRVAGSDRFRSRRFFDVETCPHVLLVRVDANIYFANATGIERRLLRLVERRAGTRELVLVCSAVSQVDSSGVLALERLARALAGVGVRLHLCQLRGDVLARISRSDLVGHLTGRIFDTPQAAMAELSQPAAEATSADRQAPSADAG